MSGERYRPATFEIPDKIIIWERGEWRIENGEWCGIGRELLNEGVLMVDG